MYPQGPQAPPPQPQSQPRSQALAMLQSEHGIDPMQRNPMSGADTQGEVVFLDPSFLPGVKEGQEVTGRFSVKKVGTKVSLLPIEFQMGTEEADEAGGASLPPV